MTKPKPRCPECDKIFATVQLIAMHRKKVHNVEGTSKAHLAAQALKAKREVEAAAPTVAQITETKTSPLPLKCVDCDFTSTNPQLLGRHRRFAHGVVGEVTRINREKMEERLRRGTGFSCPHCSFNAASRNGLGVHIASAHKNLTPTIEGETTIERPKEKRLARINSNGHPSEESHFAANGIPEGTLALALGRFQGLCQSMANEFDLPPRLFASRLAELIYRSQVR